MNDRLKSILDKIKAKQPDYHKAIEKSYTWSSKIEFGKFKGKTLQQIFDTKPEYLDWLLGQSNIDPGLDRFLMENIKKIQDAIPDEDDSDEGDEDPDDQLPFFPSNKAFQSSSFVSLPLRQIQV